MAMGSPSRRLGGALQGVKFWGSQNHTRGGFLRKHSNAQHPLLVFLLKAITWNLSIHLNTFHCWLVSHYSPALLHHQGTSAKCCAFHRFTFSFVSKASKSADVLSLPDYGRLMYPGPENSPLNHKKGYCLDDIRQVPAKNSDEGLPSWPKPRGLFSEGRMFHPMHSCQLFSVFTSFYISPATLDIFQFVLYRCSICSVFFCN
ncbi:hypothetical protein AZE42_12814 [Rhizopogon vesiculosus]|uniref:Uncharacterized protein n=1 Tax=Rhizopogon vesiculosus TaxID=180088 RepID=A0A1J8QC49_9AGAM|nr:hypothetical protein AZE42_12814 [Rhizopogon vesiculosus]